VNLVADEGVDRQIVDRLRQEGHQVWYVAELQPGIADTVVLDLANRENALLLTADKDFGELVFRAHRSMSGVLLIRLAGLAPSMKAQIVASAIQAHGDELRQAFTVVTPRTTRIRRRSF
jgi:predicted nuclease of predicted toxin-antitoxin system